VFSEPLGGRGIGHIRVQRIAWKLLPGRNRNGGRLDGRPEAVQRTRVRHGFGVSEGGGDLRIATHEVPVVLPRLPSRDSNVDDRAQDDAKPSRHASGEQVRAYLGASPHGLKRPKNSGRRGEPWFRAFCGFLKDAFTHFKRLSELQDAKLAPLLLTLIVQ
jgi:hypothetical protein